MAGITTNSVLPPAVLQTFSLRMLSTPVPNMIHTLAAQRKVLPRNGGSILRMRRFNPLPSALVPLGDSGVTPPPVQLTAVDIDAQTQLYGSYIILNEAVTLQNQENVLTEASERIGVQLRQTEDELTRDMLASTASFINCTGGVNGDNPTEITKQDCDEVIAALLYANAYTVMDNIEGEDRFGTGPVYNSYIGMCSTRLVPNLYNVDRFLNVNQYPSPKNIMRAEIGSVDNIRFLQSSIGSVTPNASNLGRNVYNIFVTGIEAYGIVDQDGESAQFVYTSPLLNGPLALNSTTGWKMRAAFRILNDQWVLNMRCTLS